MKKSYRRTTRNKVLPGTHVQLKYYEKNTANEYCTIIMTANVDNICADGVFVNTDEKIPCGTRVYMTIDFQIDGVNLNQLNATGIIVRVERKGFAVKFSNIDINSLWDCIIYQLNSIAEKRLVLKEQAQECCQGPAVRPKITEEYCF